MNHPSRRTTRLLATSAVGAMLAAAMAAPIAGATSVAWPPDATWTLNGNAAVSGTTLNLTQNLSNQDGSAWLNTPLASANLDVTFQVQMGVPWGADGVTLSFANPSTNPATTLGSSGGGLGFTTDPTHVGVSGVGVALDTYQNVNDPSKNFVGILTGGTAAAKTWLATKTLTSSLYGSHNVEVTYVGGILTVLVDANQVLSTAVSLPSSVRVGFTGSTGGLTNVHSISNFSLSNGAELSTGGPNGALVVTTVAGVAFAVSGVAWRRRRLAHTAN